jgi:hypothetical protein
MNTECIKSENENIQVREELSEKQKLLKNMLLSGVELYKEDEFKKISAILLEEEIYDLSKITFSVPIALKQINKNNTSLTVYYLDLNSKFYPN